MKPNQAAFDIGQMTERMVQGYFMHLAAIQVATDPRAVALSPKVEPGQIVPVAYVGRKDSTQIVFHFTHSLAQAGSNPAMVDDLDRAKFPAHNRLAWVRSDSKAEFEITPNLQKQPVLFDFMGPGDILDLLMSVGLYLVRMGNGDPLRP